MRTVASLPAAAFDADVIVFHCSRVNSSSIELLGNVHRLGFNIPVVLLTGEAAPAHECLALDKGAIDVILESRGPDVLARRLKGVVESTAGSTDRPLSGGPLKCGKLLLRPDIGRACWKDVDVGLTLGEYNIVHLLASNAGRYKNYRTIYDRLHYKGFIAGKGAAGYRTNVRSTIKRIRNRFRALDSTFDEIENYQGFGYCWKMPD